MHNFKLNKIVAIVFTMALFSSMFFSISILPTIKQVQGSEGSEPWLEGWDYRKNHTICNATGAGTNYQIKINVEYGNGADSGDTVYLNGSCKSDFGDIRFTGDDAVTELDYWMESKNDSNNAVFWVQVIDDLSNSSAIIYVYYGNAAASATSDGVATFDFFDTFDGASLNASKWDILAGAPTVGASELYLQRTDGYETIMANWGDDDGLSTTREIRAKWRYTQTEGNHGTPSIRFGISETNLTLTNYHLGAWYEYAGGRIYNCLNGDYSYSAANDPDLGSYYSVTRILSGGVQFKSWGAQTCDWTKTGTPNLYSGYTYLGVGWDAGIYVDWIFTRKYVEFEPVHGSWGVEESQASSGTESWLDGWEYRKNHTICSATGAGTNYQVKINVDYGNGADSGDAVYLNGSSRTDFSDVRFTDDDGVTELDYWVQSKNDSDSAVFWVEIADDLSVSNANIYIYYGNYNATTTSNGVETFVFFDDFEDNLDLWNSTGTTAIASEFAYKGSNCFKGGMDQSYIQRSSLGYTNVSVHVMYWDNQTTGHETQGLIVSGSSGVGAIQVHENVTATNYAYRIGSEYYASNVSRSNDWHEFCIRTSATTREFILDDLYQTSIMNQTAIDSITLGSWWTANSADSYFDACFVRNYVSLEPTHGTWGTEESA